MMRLKNYQTQVLMRKQQRKLTIKIILYDNIIKYDNKRNNRV